MDIGDGHKYEEQRIRVLHNNVSDSLTGIGFMDEAIFINKNHTRL